ncbi:MAG: hypothetical protein QM802_11265 [Agriterribacter sp.]
MERNIHMDEFEKFLKEKSDQYKLYPSDKLWGNINRSIHPRKKWPYIALTLVLLLSTAVLVDYNSSNYLSPGKKSVSQLSGNNFDSNASAKDIFSKNISAEKFASKATPSVIKFTHDNNVNKNPVSAAGNSEMAADAAIPLSDDVQIFINKPNVTSIESDENYNAFTNSLKNSTSIKKNQVTGANNRTRNDDADEKPVKKVLWGGEAFKKSKFEWQLSFSPTISYRKLTSGLSQVTEIFRGVPYTNTTVEGSTSVNNLVTHKPAVGAEVGASLAYKLSKNFILKTGLQFNYSRYQVKAYSSKPQIAVLAVQNSRGGTDSLNFISTLENYDGGGSKWFNNEYLQISMPIGFEWSVLGNSTFKWNIAASAQPVYNFANNVYLLSTDFKHYVQDPSLVRKWNINAGIETFISYDMGSFKWQAGPQLRYQLMSSYQRSYPIKEHMVDVGFKIGIIKTLR